MREDMVLWFLDGATLGWAAFLFRWTIALALMPHGIAKFRNPQKAEHFFPVFFLPPRASYYCAAFMETAVSACLLLGLFTRFAALGGLVTMAIASSKSWNSSFTSPALVFLLGMFSILCIGPGAISLDYLFLGQ